VVKQEIATAERFSVGADSCTHDDPPLLVLRNRYPPVVFETMAVQSEALPQERPETDVIVAGIGVEIH
jgi:hypothetical protein